MDHGVKAGRNSPKAKSDICRSDTYVIVNDVCKLCREMSFILVITGFSLSSVCFAEPEEEGTCCKRSPARGVSSFACSSPAHWGQVLGICTLSCRIGQSANWQLGFETHSQLGSRRRRSGFIVHISGTLATLSQATRRLRFRS
jgi:hypothetical protein